MTPGHVESEAACARCALTPSAPVRGTEMGMQLQLQVGVCVPRHELIMQPRRPLITLGLCFKSSIRSRGYVDVLLYCSRSCVAHA